MFQYYVLFHTLLRFVLNLLFTCLFFYWAHFNPRVLVFHAFTDSTEL